MIPRYLILLTLDDIIDYEVRARLLRAMWTTLALLENGHVESALAVADDREFQASLDRYVPACPAVGAAC